MGRAHNSLTLKDLAPLPLSTRLGGRVIFLAEGRAVGDQQAEAFLTHPQSAEAAAYLRGEI